MAFAKKKKKKNSIARFKYQIYKLCKQICNRDEGSYVGGRLIGQLRWNYV